MYTEVSDAYQSKIAESSRTFKAKIQFGDYPELVGEIRTVTSEVQSNSDKETISIGGTSAQTVNIEMQYDQTVNIAGEFSLAIGLLLDDDMLEYIPMGIFTPQKPTYSQDKSIVSFTAYDRMVSKFERTYSTDITSYPVDGKIILEEISTKSGVPLGNIDDLPDGVMVNARTVKYGDSGNQIVAPFFGCTYRAAVGYLAQMYGKFATINRAGELELRWYQEVDYTVGENRIFDGEFGDLYILKKIECTATDGTLTAGEGETGISITNPVMTQEILDDVFASIAPMSYLPYSGSYLGDPRIDLGDIITVAGNKVPVMSISQDFDGGLTTEVGSYGKTEEEENNPNGPTQQAIERIQEELENISGITVYEYSNEEAIQLSDKDANIILIRYMAEQDTKAEFKAEILLNVSADSETISAADSAGNVITFPMDGKAVITFTYRINQEKLVTHIPVETLGSGAHIITLFYQINGIKGDTLNSFEVLARIENGTADIAVGGIIATVSGDGFANTEIKWDGNVDVEDVLPTINVNAAITLILPDDAVTVNKFVESYTMSTDRADKYEYDPDHVSTADGQFALITAYSYESYEGQIDSGRLAVLEIPTSDFSQVESIEVT